MSKKDTSLAIGIDLGTTYSCVGVMKNGAVEIIANDQGNRTMPSYVSFGDESIMIGESAKNEVTLNPTNTVFDAKRLIGRQFEDKVVVEDMKHWPFKVVPRNGKPYVEVKYKGEAKVFSPEEISAQVLIRMKETAESYLGQKVTKAVITVPAYFNDSQRQATKDAGAIAGLNVLRIINEPTAAALAYGLETSSEAEKNVLIFDCGGGTHDVSVLNIADGVFEVKATGGDTHLGGEDIDNLMVDYFVDEFKKKYQKNLRSNPKSLRRLRTQCERAKRNLSAPDTVVTNIQIDCLYDGIDFESTMTRAKFESICHDIFKRTLAPVEKVLSDAKLSKGDIHEIVLVGGTTRIPKIQQMLSEYFNGKKLNNSVNPDEAVAYGAAVQAAMLNNDCPEQNANSRVTGMVVVDVIPLSLGIETLGGRMTVMIERNTTKPVKKTQTFSTATNNQRAVTITVYEGERAATKDCHKLGSFNLEGIPPMPAGQPQVEVTYEVNANGILDVTAVEKSKGERKTIKITGDKNRLSQSDIARMVADAQKFAEEDRIFKENMDARNQLEQYLSGVQSSVSVPEFKSKLSDEDVKTLEKCVEEGHKWVGSNPHADKASYEAKLKEYEQTCQSIITKTTKDANKEDQTQTQTPPEVPKSNVKVEEID